MQVVGQYLEHAGIVGCRQTGCLIPTYAQPSRASPDPKLRQDSCPGSPDSPLYLGVQELLLEDRLGSSLEGCWHERPPDHFLWH